MPLWTTRSSLYRAVSASYAFSGGCRPAREVVVLAKRAAVFSPRRLGFVLTNKRLPEPCGVHVDQPLPQSLEARIAARVAREQANGTYDYRDPVQRSASRAVAVKRNGGLRGSKATCWSR